MTTLLAALCCLAPAGPASCSRAAGRQPLDVVVLLDNSGSMVRQGATAGSDEGFVRVTAVQYLVEKLGPQDRVALLTFDRMVHTDPRASGLIDPAMPAARQAFYSGVAAIASSPHGATNMAAGLRAAAAVLERQSARGRRRFLLFLTDGTPDPASGANTPAALEQYAGTLKRQGIRVFTVGLGELAPTPAGRDAAGDLLRQIAERSGGAMFQASSGTDLPPLFGQIFAQLVGHEVTRMVAAGETATIPLDAGATDLRILAAAQAGGPRALIRSPGGEVVPFSGVPQLMPGKQKSMLAAVSQDSPATGVWTVRSVNGAAEVAWEPGFEVDLLAPQSNTLVPAHAPLQIRVRARLRSGQASPLAGGRVVAELESGLGSESAVLSPEAGGAAGAFSGAIPDTGAPGWKRLTVRCYQTVGGQEEEGGPAYAELDVAAVPALSLLTPQDGARQALPAPVSVLAGLTLNGRPVARLRAGLRLEATLRRPGGGDVTGPLRPAGGGRWGGAFPPGSRAGAADVTVSLTGTENGLPLSPQAEERRITLALRPVVELVSWSGLPSRADPGGQSAAQALVRSSAPREHRIRLSLAGAPGAELSPAALVVPAYSAPRTVDVRILWRNASPGDYAVTITPSGDAGADFRLAPLQGRVHVRNWLERNGWWFWPALALVALVTIIAILAAAAMLRAAAARALEMRTALAQTAAYVPYATQSFRLARPTDRRSITFGGPGSDVQVANPRSPGESLFGGPRILATVDWNRSRGRARIRLSPVGADTSFSDAEGGLITHALDATEQDDGVEFEVMPEKVPVRVCRDKGALESQDAHPDDS